MHTASVTHSETEARRETEMRTASVASVRGTRSESNTQLDRGRHRSRAGEGTDTDKPERPDTGEIYLKAPQFA